MDSTEYMFYSPANAVPGKKYPVALALHGCCGTDYHATLRNAVDPIVRMWHQFGKNKQTIPTYIIAPKTSRGWRQHFGNLKRVIDSLIANGMADPQRIYICGFSMGGEGTFEMIQRYPGYFAAAITMGMAFHGDSSKVKDIPLWCNQGETDWYSRKLRKDVAGIRHLNGDPYDSGATWVTGVNPRYSNFKGVDHGVMWDAASKQDLTGWAYSKINNGNIYPVVYIRRPAFREKATAGKPVTLNIEAHDPDGRIEKLDIYLNGKKLNSIYREPYQQEILPVAGDNHIRVVAFDNGGKTSEANSVLEVDMQPEFISKKIASAKAGAWYEFKLLAKGNGDLSFSNRGSHPLPEGMILYPDGTLKGIPVKAGKAVLQVTLTDANGKKAERDFPWESAPRAAGTVTLTGVLTKEGHPYRVASMKKGAAPFFDGKDSLLKNEQQEVNFTDPGKYTGLTFIQTDQEDANKIGPGFLNFRIDEDALVYVAYEKTDRLFHSSIPAWLKDFKKEDGELVAQYRYFAVYSKLFPKGLVSLPAADAKSNGVSSNYFVMVKKK
jgi:pimeloyl-ACP methyl ester carboxylesterase